MKEHIKCKNGGTEKCQLLPLISDQEERLAHWITHCVLAFIIIIVLPNVCLKLILKTARY